MSKTNSTDNKTTNNVITQIEEELKNVKLDVSDIEEVKFHVLKVMDKQFGKKPLEGLGAEKIESLANDITETFQFGALADHVGGCLARQTLASYKNPRWYADKVSGAVIDTGVKALLIGGSYMAYQAYKNRNTDVVPSASGDSPFSSTDGFTASPRPLRTAKRAESNVASIS